MSTSPGPWPGGREGAVSLTFDDGLSSHLSLAHPILADHDLLGTFYVIPAGEDEVAWRAGLAPWRPVAAAGHEIGNHSLTHTCSRNHAGVAGGGVEAMTLGELEAELAEAERRLRAGIPEHRGGRSFCYPCYQSHIGIGPTRQSYVPVVAGQFPAARAKGDKPNCPRGVDLHYVWSWGVERCSGAELIGLCEWAAIEGRWAVLTFHGINEGHLPVGEADLRLLCTHLNRHRDRIWTAPLLTVAEHLIGWRKEVADG